MNQQTFSSQANSEKYSRESRWEMFWMRWTWCFHRRSYRL